MSKNQKGFAPVLILVVVAVVLGVGYLIIPKPGGIEYIKQQFTWPRPTPTPTPPPGCYYDEVICIQAPCPPQLVCPSPGARHEPNGSVEIANWKEYVNRKYNFSIKYPQDWMYKEVSVLTPSIDEIWFSPKSLGFPPEGTDARTPVVLKVSKDDLSKDWQAEFFNDYKSSVYSLASGVSARRITGINKESLYPEVAVIITIGNFYVAALPNQGSESTKYFDQILSTFKFTQ